MTTTSAPAPAPASGGAEAAKKKKATKASGAGTKAKKPARRKKPTAKSSSGSTNQATWNAARASQMELASQRNQAAARRSDPLWYRIEDVLPASQDETPMASSASVLPEQLQIVETALANNQMTRTDVTPQAFACLLEQARRYALELLADAQDYAYVASRNEIARPDLLLANEMRPDHPVAVTTQLPKLNLLASQINRVPLPPIPTQCYSGVLLPPKQHQLTARTFDVVSGAQVAQKMVQAAPSLPKKASSKSSKPSYGAARGRQIPIALKEKEPEEKPTPMDTGGSSPTVPVPSSAAPTSVPSSEGPASAPANAPIATPTGSASPGATMPPAATTMTASPGATTMTASPAATTMPASPAATTMTASPGTTTMTASPGAPPGSSPFATAPPGSAPK
jgi:histone H3/H4